MAQTVEELLKAKPKDRYVDAKAERVRYTEEWKKWIVLLQEAWVAEGKTKKSLTDEYNVAQQLIDGWAGKKPKKKAAQKQAKAETGETLSNKIVRLQSEIEGLEKELKDALTQRAKEMKGEQELMEKYGIKVA